MQYQLDKYYKMTNNRLRRCLMATLNAFEHYEAASFSELSAMNGLGIRFFSITTVKAKMTMTIFTWKIIT